MRHEDLKFRKYTVNSPFGNTSFIVDNSQVRNIETPPTMFDNGTLGFSYSYSNLRDYNGVDIAEDGKEFIFGIPLGMTKQDIIKMIEFETYGELTKALRRDTFVNVKSVPDIKINTGNRDEFLAIMLEHIKEINATRYR